MEDFISSYFCLGIACLLTINNKQDIASKIRPERTVYENLIAIYDQIKLLIYNLKTVDDYEQITFGISFLRSRQNKIDFPFPEEANEKAEELTQLLKELSPGVSKENKENILQSMKIFTKDSDKHFLDIRKLEQFKERKIDWLWLNPENDLKIVREAWQRDVLNKFRENNKINFQTLMEKAKNVESTYAITKLHHFLSILIYLFVIKHEEGNLLREELNKKYGDFAIPENSGLPFYESQLNEIKKQISEITPRLKIINKIELQGIESVDSYVLKLRAQMYNLQEAKKFYEDVISSKQ